MKLPSIKKTLDLFKVDETEIAHILESVRSQLPTTEALLIGKPQAGKSSIVRGLTGVGEEIVGQGFRPHTQYTKRYAYPSEDLPLLIFTDTVGLGDVDKNTEEIITELTTQLDIETKRARILILTVKINDFATDSLKNIAENLRKKYPQIPCLLVVTSLHELYPNLHSNHPEYPPNFPEIDRAFSEIKNTFSDLFAQLFSSYLTEDNIFNINSFINELDVSSEQWNSQSVLLKMNISIDIEEDVNRVDEVGDLEEESAPILIPDAKILTDQDTINILKIFTLTHFLENALYRYTAKAMIEEQQR